MPPKKRAARVRKPKTPKAPEPIRFVMWGSRACAYCPSMAKVMQRWGEKHPEITFEIKESDDHEEEFDKLDASCVPITIFYRGKKEIGRIEGACGIHEVEKEFLRIIEGAGRVIATL